MLNFPVPKVEKIVKKTNKVIVQIWVIVRKTRRQL